MNALVALAACYFFDLTPWWWFCAGALCGWLFCTVRNEEKS